MRAGDISGSQVERAPGPRAIVAIPVRNEEDRIVACLDALARQVGLGPHELGVVLLLNNCTDGTAASVASLNLPHPMRVREHDSVDASAGWARRLAMDAASAWLAETAHSDGVLLTTDADTCVGADWVARNLAAIRAGADLVAGRIALDPHEAALLPDRLHSRGRMEAAYEALLTEIDARLDPQPANPWPCHWSKSGATLAVRHAVYVAVGGMPDMATGEDRAFVDAVSMGGFIVRHAQDIEVVTSGRLDGRARGGVADTMKMRCTDPDSPCDDRLERVSRLVARALWRRRLRALYRAGRLSATWRWAPALGVATPVAQRIAALERFGRAHAAIEGTSPWLAYRPMRPRHLPRQIRHASHIVWMLRTIDGWRAAVRGSHTKPATCLRLAEDQPSQS